MLYIETLISTEATDVHVKVVLRYSIEEGLVTEVPSCNIRFTCEAVHSKQEAIVSIQYMYLLCNQQITQPLSLCSHNNVDLPVREQTSSGNYCLYYAPNIIIFRAKESKEIPSHSVVFTYM